MTSSAIFDGLETGLERYDWKPNTQRQKREKIYLHYNPRSKSNWKEKVQENKNQNIEPFIRKIWLIFIDVILEQITAFLLLLLHYLPLYLNGSRGVLITEVLILEVLKVVKS